MCADNLPNVTGWKIVDLEELERYLRRLSEFIRARHEEGAEVFLDVAVTIRLREKEEGARARR